jgi:hypothetical protein
MASNINFIGIDETFPVAGRDNDSQGFRDNYSIIKNNFEAAKSEIEDLQLNTARLDIANNFNNNNIVRANFVNCSEELYDGAIVNITTLVNYQNGPYQIFQLTNDVQFTLINFPPSGKLGKIRVQLTADNTNRIATFGLSGGGTLKKEASVPSTITVNSSIDPIIFEFWSYNAGNTVFMRYLGQFV